MARHCGEVVETAAQRLQKVGRRNTPHRLHGLRARTDENVGSRHRHLLAFPDEPCGTR
jgi:hypothetical protein